MKKILILGLLLSISFSQQAVAQKAIKNESIKKFLLEFLQTAEKNPAQLGEFFEIGELNWGTKDSLPWFKDPNQFGLMSKSVDVNNAYVLQPQSLKKGKFSDSLRVVILKTSTRIDRSKRSQIDLLQDDPWGPNARKLFGSPREILKQAGIPKAKASQYIALPLKMTPKGPKIYFGT